MKTLVYAFILSFVTTLSIATYAIDKKDNIQEGYGAAGYDLVSYIQDLKAEAGSKTYSASYNGTVYLFKSVEHKTEFLKSPSLYLPQYGGWCAYAMADNDNVEVDPKTFKVIEGKLYLFYNGLWGNTLNKWNKDEVGLKKKADKNWGLEK
ncbi:MAG: hypothetical protein K2P81_10465 [Bacteriovoracaceae bacterium]|nr:hypothetical protein [Bacteriovoracaceae bacterium]